MKESALIEIFLHAGIFLVLSALIIPLLKSFKVPVSLGYLLAGIAFGPYALGAFATTIPNVELFNLGDAEHVKILAELGIVLLLFVIGLELTPLRLWQMRSLVFGLGGAQVILTAIVVSFIAYAWGNNLNVSILLGLGFALSSTAIVTQWLHEQKLFVSHVGRTSFSILLFQDLAIIPILLFLTILSTDMGDSVTSYVTLSLGKMFATILAIYFLGKVALKPVFLFANKYGGSEVFMALCLLVIVVSASIASLAGLSMALGAFIAGLLLADTEYRHEISSLIVPFKSMLLGIFFLSFGMGIDLNYIVEKPVWIFLSVIGLMCLKACIIFLLCKLWKQSTAVSTESAILLSQAGEFGLLVVGSALTSGIMEQDVGQFMLITVGITMMIAPIIAPLARKAGKYIESKIQSDDYNSHTPEFEILKNHIIILGYGRIGRITGERLCHEGYKIIGFDRNIDTVNKARNNSTPVYYGDARRAATLKAAQIDKALCVILALDGTQSGAPIVDIIRTQNLNIPIIVRAHDKSLTEKLKRFDNIEIVLEDRLIADMLSETVLHRYNLVEVDEKETEAA